MLLPLKDLITKHKMNITGVIHVGAHHGEEVHAYREMGIKPIILIEPCEKAFNILKEKFSADRDILLLNFAIGNEEGVRDMNVETMNSGQSNSLLKPKLHLKHYSNITFDWTEPVIVTKLDTLSIGYKNTNLDFKAFNFLNADIQGFEGEMLKGAKETLRFIDYIYLEVNDAEVYENNSTLEQLDAMLGEYYDRVELYMTDANWGDALWIRKKPQPKLGSAEEGADDLAKLNSLIEKKVLVGRGHQKFYDELCDKINQRRLALDALGDALKKSFPFYNYSDYFKNLESELLQCESKIFLAKAWYGKINGLLGFDTPYKNDGNRTTVADIEPVAQKATEVVIDLGNYSIIQFVDFLHEKIKEEIDLIPDFAHWEEQITDYLFDLPGIDSFELKTLPGETIPEIRREGDFIYQHLCEARFHLGFALGTIRENSQKA